MRPASNSIYRDYYYRRIICILSLFFAQIITFAQSSENEIDDKTLFFGKVETAADIEKLKTGVAENNQQSMLMLSTAYLHGNIVRQDTSEAVKLLQSCVNKGQFSSIMFEQKAAQSAMLRLTAICHSGYMKEHGQELFAWMLNDAKAGNARAMLITGNLYREGNVVAKDSTEGFNWYLKAAQKKDNIAMGLVAAAYDNGWSVAKDSTQALAWYIKAADAGNADAMNNLGIKYRKGKWVKRDYKKAFELFEKSANAGNIFGMTNYGMMYEFGKGTIKDEETAAKWYLKVTDKSLRTEAIYRMGFFFEKGKGTIKQNDAAAMNCYKKSGPNAYCRIGNFYEKGKGVIVDLQEAGKWYKKAADLNMATGMYWLGHWYEINGDNANASSWFQKAVDALNNYIAKSIDDAEAMFILATMYENGNGTKKNIQQAIDIYKTAADLGNEDAEARLRELIH